MAHCDLPVVDVAVVPVVAAVVLVVDVAVVPAAAVVGSEAACCRDLALASSSSYTGSRTRCKATSAQSARCATWEWWWSGIRRSTSCRPPPPPPQRLRSPCGEANPSDRVGLILIGAPAILAGAVSCWVC